MTAICAILARASRHSARELIGPMQMALEKHGADRRATWADDEAALAIDARQTLPEDQFDCEPAVADGIVLIADIRLDNRNALATTLGIPSRDAAVMADSALLRCAWMRWQEQVVDHIIGDFAFVIWNAREHRLFAACDPFGNRPLCYAKTSEGFALASAPAGILALPSVSAELDEAQLARSLIVGFEDQTKTFYRGIAMLPPGHVLRATHEQWETRCYWSPTPREIRYRRDEEYVEHFREVFDAAVGCRLRAVGPIASTLSAGFDSGSVTAVAARQLAEHNCRLTALTWRPGTDAPIPVAHGAIVDESEAAARVAARFANVDHRFVSGADQSPLEATMLFAAAMRQPFRSTLNAPLYAAMSRELDAQGSGHRVMLHGQYGNFGISYSGETSLSWLLRRGRVATAAREMVALNRRAKRSVLGIGYQAIGPFLPEIVHRTVSNARRDPNSLAHFRSAINPAFAEAHALVASTASQWRGRYAVRPPVDGWAIRWPSAQWSLFGPVYKGMEAALGLEFRDPTMDIRVLEYCLAIPEDQFLKGGQSRWLIRRAMEGALPPETLGEQRRGLQGSDWPRYVAPYRSEFTDVLADIERSPLARAALDLDHVRSLLDAWPTQWTPAMRVPVAQLILSALTVGQFIRRFGSAAQAGQ